MRILVCGGRDLDDKEFIFSTLDALDKEVGIHYVITGGARGADYWANCWASHHKKEVSVFPAQWEKFGKGAGIIRNKQMLDYGQPEMIVAFPGGRGTADMVKRAKKAEVEVREIKYG